MKHTFLVSDESQNSHGFTVLTEGINTDNFVKNPIMLYMHERANVIGRWENLEKKEGKLYADAIFDTSSQKGKEVAAKVENGFLKAASIGITFNRTDLQDNIVKASNLLEISVVDIGSNANALKLYNAENFASLYFGDILQQSEISKALGLAEPTHADIMHAVTQLVNFQNEIKKDRLYEADELVDLAINRKVLPENLKEMQLRFFAENFTEAKNKIVELITASVPANNLKLYQTLADFQRYKQITEGKTKAEWTLDEYRRFAPKELEKDPQLFRRLYEEKYKTTNI